jgi:hypothetical protein
MGYCIDQLGCNFFIKAEDKVKALQAVKKLMKLANKIGQGGSYGPNGKTEQWFSWVGTADVLKADTLEKAMEEWRYCPSTDEWGNINSVRFYGEKLGQEMELFKVLAPFVKDGSYIEMQGEDGSVWRWAFKKGEVKEQAAKFVYND